MSLKSFASHRLAKAVALIAAFSIPLVAYSAGAVEGASTVAAFARRLLGARAHQYSTAPKPAYLGKPGKTATRGPLWKANQLKNNLRELEVENLYASAQGFSEEHSISVEAAPGGSLPWEGSAPASNGSVNTGNGNKLTKLPLFSFKSRGGTAVDFTLFHNSQTTYDDELGYGWTWSYDIYINNLTGNPVVHWGDGLAVPYTAPVLHVALKRKSDAYKRRFTLCPISLERDPGTSVQAT